jgi:hypothetical protein
MNEHIRRQGRGATFDEEQWGRIKQVAGQALGKAAAWLQLAKEDFVAAPQRQRADMLMPTIVAVKVLIDETFKPWLLAVDRCVIPLGLVVRHALSEGWVYERRQRNLHHRVDSFGLPIVEKGGVDVRVRSEFPPVSDASVLCAGGDAGCPIPSKHGT